MLPGKSVEPEYYYCQHLSRIPFFFYSMQVLNVHVSVECKELPNDLFRLHRNFDGLHWEDSKVSYYLFVT